MIKLSATFLFGSLLLYCVFGPCVEAQQPSSEGFGSQDLNLAKEITTTLRFYVQDLVSGENRTAFKVAQANITLPSFFGLVLVLDNLVTSGPKIDSGDVGRIQGAVALSDLDEPALAMLLNIVFTKGVYNGSTLNVVGRNPLLEKARELSIVGGTGVFRMARGYIITKTYSIDENTNGVYEYNVFVSHRVDHKELSSMNVGNPTCDVQP